MKQLRDIFDKLQKNESLEPIRPVINAADNFFFGPPEVTDSAPHIVDNMDIKRYMILVVAALLPTVVAAIYYYGWRVLAIILVSYSFGGLTEVVFALIRRKKIDEGFLVTGLIFPLILPPTIPLWVVAIGVVFGVTFGKEVFGGTGRNIFNPAIVGRVFIVVAFSLLMTNFWYQPFQRGLGGLMSYHPDVITSATPLILNKLGGITEYPYLDLLIGRAPGTIGEVFRLGIIAGGIFLSAVKVSNWRIPTSYLGSVLLFSGLGYLFIPAHFAPPLFQLLSGGLLFAAFFMATDPVTSPYTRGGMWIFGVGLGFLTVLIRGFTGYVEGVMFSLIVMNALTPLIDKLVMDLKYKPIKNTGVVYHEN